MRRETYLYIVIASIFLFAGCRDVVLTPQPVQPFYKTIASFKDYSDVEKDSVLRADSLEIDLMLQILGKKFVWHEDTLKNAKDKSPEFENQNKIPLVKDVMAEISRTIQPFIPAVDSVYSSLDGLEDNLGMILENAKDLGIYIPERKYAAVVWSLKLPLVTTDSIMFIALNHFLGEDFPGYGWVERYNLPSKTPEQLPYAITEALIGVQYPYQWEESSTALSRMMYEGAMTYIKLKLVPNATLSKTLGYTTDQLEWLDRHYKEMWETVIGKNMIYSTSRFLTERLVNPAPNTSIISPEYPGRAGRYLGYRLILNYMENNAKTPLTKLLSPEFYNNPSELVLAQ